MSTETPLLLALDFTGTLVFALNGALTAVRAERLDIFGSDHPWHVHRTRWRHDSRRPAGCPQAAWAAWIPGVTATALGVAGYLRGESLDFARTVRADADVRYL